MSALSASDLHVRLEEAGDLPSIRRINELAFQTSVEADIYEALRAAGAITLSMVAVVDAAFIGAEPFGGDANGGAGVSTWGGDGGSWGQGVVGGEVIGHALVTPVAVATEKGDESLFGLGPVAVLPSEQGRGIGTLLISACLEQLRESGRPGVVVLGHPGYYPRFGFIPASRWGLRLDIEVPDEAFMALELSPGRLAGISGVVRFRPEFTKAMTQEQAAPEAPGDRRSEPRPR
ncbi:MAG: hypothetical protein A2133_09260 [Actinobacteria bacterium RBG_16_64_13]|nr:MAG: hypothetical protein A2133_09260 [Actinobacteria bacterium RBG_16_64_13]